MDIRNRITDYHQNIDEIEKWLKIKGETKYSQFADILDSWNEPVLWERLSNLYRYDKRLLVNIFRYMSFYEEFLRAIIWNNCPQKTYEDLKNKYLKDVIIEVLKIDSISDELWFYNLNKNKDYVNRLRNDVSHNKIILQTNLDDKNYLEIIRMFSDVLPSDYKVNFIKEIEDCKKGFKFII